MNGRKTRYDHEAAVREGTRSAFWYYNAVTPGLATTALPYSHKLV